MLSYIYCILFFLSWVSSWLKEVRRKCSQFSVNCFQASIASKCIKIRISVRNDILNPQLSSSCPNHALTWHSLLESVNNSCWNARELIVQLWPSNCGDCVMGASVDLAWGSRVRRLLISESCPEALIRDVAQVGRVMMWTHFMAHLTLIIRCQPINRSLYLLRGLTDLLTLWIHTSPQQNCVINWNQIFLSFSCL